MYQAGIDSIAENAALPIFDNISSKMSHLRALLLIHLGRILISIRSFYSGLTAQSRLNQYFARLGLSNAMGADYYLINTSLTLGMEF